MSMTKARLHQKVLENKEELIQLVSDLIKIPSENPNGEQNSAISFVEQYLKETGIQAERISCDPKYPCLTAKIGSDSGFSIICNGHVDVVPIGDRAGWKFEPFGGEVAETVIRGRGASDMKAGVAGLLFVMKLLFESGAELKGNIRLHIVSDEESGGNLGTGWLCGNGYADNADACLIAEPTSGDNIEIGQKGICHMTLKAHGTPAHGSLGNYVGDNAIIKLAKVLINIDKLTSVQGKFDNSQIKALKNSRIIASKAVNETAAQAIDHLTANVGLISGGNKINVVPDYCEAKVDMRLPIGTKREHIEKAVEQLIAESGVTGVDIEMNWKAESNYTDYDASIVQVFRKNAEYIWGTEILPAYQWASSDARYYRELGIPTIQFGPANCVGIHSYNEDVDIEDVVHSAEIYMLSICELLGVD